MFGKRKDGAPKSSPKKVEPVIEEFEDINFDEGDNIPADEIGINDDLPVGTFKTSRTADKPPSRLADLNERFELGDVNAMNEDTYSSDRVTNPRIEQARRRIWKDLRESLDRQLVLQILEYKICVVKRWGPT